MSLRRSVVVLCLLVALGCGNDDDPGDSDGGTGSGSTAADPTGDTSGMSGGSAGVIDCSDTDRGQALSCSNGQMCCAVVDAGNFCAADCGDEVAFECDGAEDCAGNACCTGIPGPGAGTACSDASTCDPGGQPVCTTSETCPDEVPCCLAATINGRRTTLCGEWDGPGCL
jgi:hypothetical protein